MVTPSPGLAYWGNEGSWGYKPPTIPARDPSHICLNGDSPYQASALSLLKVGGGQPLPGFCPPSFTQADSTRVPFGHGERFKTPFSPLPPVYWFGVRV